MSIGLFCFTWDACLGAFIAVTFMDCFLATCGKGGVEREYPIMKLIINIYQVI